MVWQCNSKFKDKTRCKTPHLTEEEIRQGFIKAVNRLLTIREEVVANLREVQGNLSDTTALEREIERLEDERNILAQKIQQLIDENARTAQDQTDYQRRYDELAEKYSAADAALTAAQERLRQKEKRSEQIEDFVSEIEALPDGITGFEEDCWGHLVEKITVFRGGGMKFTFACGVEIDI